MDDRIVPSPLARSFGSEEGSCFGRNLIQKKFVISVSDGPVTNTRLDVLEADLEGLKDIFQNPPVGPKDGSYFVRGQSSTGQRSDQSIPHGPLLILDGDKSFDPATGDLHASAPHPRLVHESLIEMEVPHLIHTTHSHDPERHVYKFRVIIPVPLQSHEELLAVVDYFIVELNKREVYLANVGENGSWSQPWYFPRLRESNAEFLLYHHDEVSLLSRSFVESIVEDWRNRRHASRAAAQSHDFQFDARPISGAIGRYMQDHGRPEQMLALLEEYGYVFSHFDSVNGEVAYRCLMPGSKTGQPGVHLYSGRVDGRWLVYSFHGSDPLRGTGDRPRALDAFGLYTALVHGDDQRKSMEALKEMQAQDDGEIDRETAWELINDISTWDDDQYRADQLTNDVARKVHASSLISEVDKAKMLGKIAKLAHATLKALRADLEGYESIRADRDNHHLQAAWEVVNWIGPENLVGQASFLWSWQSSGVWEKCDDRKIKKLIHQVAESSELTKTVCDSILDLIKTEVFRPDIVFDRANGGINLPNGELHWTGQQFELRPQVREHYRTTQIPVTFDRTALAPRFDQFLDEIFRGDSDARDKRRILLQMLGYSLMADCRYERFAILVGNGANGKTVFLSVLAALLGSKNVSGVQPSQFDNRFQRAHLHGKLANIVTEMAEGEEIADAALKAIVSGELTTAEHKFKPPFDFCPFVTCWFGTNHMPHSRDFSDALFRRAFVLTFNQKFYGKARDEGLKDKLLQELPGILNMALDGLADVFQNGFIEPQSCVEAKKDWQLQCDQIARFVDECCMTQPGHFEASGDIYRAYQAWAAEEGIYKVLSKGGVSKRLEAMGFKLGHNPTKTKRGVYGIKLKK